LKIYQLTLYLRPSIPLVDAHIIHDIDLFSDFDLARPISELKSDKFFRATGWRSERHAKMVAILFHAFQKSSSSILASLIIDFTVPFGSSEL